MKLLRSTFVVFYLASDQALAFSPQIYSKSVSSQLQSVSPPHHSPTSLFVGLHDKPDSQISEEEIKRDTMFREVLREVNLAKEYLAYLVEKSTDAVEETDGPTMGEALKDAAAAGEVGLFGGGGDAPAEKPKEQVYKPALRTDLGGTVLLSGTADSTLLNILNNNFFGQDNVPNFEFGTIKALVADVAAAKKSAISREARYSGLLDKLVIEQASSGGALPSKEELAGATSWIARISAQDATTALPELAELAKGSEELKNVVVMVDGTSSSTVEGWDSVVEASSGGEAFRCTLLAVGELHESRTGGLYHVGALADAPVGPTRLLKKKAHQLLAHALALDSTAGRMLTAYEQPADALEAVATPYAEGDFAVRDDDGNEQVDEYKDVKMEGRMIQAMREVGFTLVMELDVLVSKGIDAFKEYIANPPNKENVFAKTKTALDEEDERIMAMLEAKSEETEAIKKKKAEEQRKIDIQGIAKEWAIKEYSLRMLGGLIDESVSENDFMVSVWDEALAEGERTYEKINTEEYIRQRESKSESLQGTEDKLFWEGMPVELRKKREKMVEKVKKQYMDLLSDAELEQIILNE